MRVAKVFGIDVEAELGHVGMEITLTQLIIRTIILK